MVTLKQLQYGAAAIALGCSLGLTATAGAQIVEEDTMGVTVQIESTFNLTVTQPLNLGVASLFTTNAGTDPTLTIAADDGDVEIGVNDTSNFFFVVDETAATQGTVTIDGALPTTIIHLTIPEDALVGPVNTGNTLAITAAEILETSPASANASGSLVGNDVTMDLTTDGSGEAAFSVGITLTADADNATQYPDGVYTGSLDVNANY